ncbi:MAG: RNA polymerase sigma factor [Oscillibacter sp.]|nr:RNA polymerase sigma factor [Oscillibacter sp.]
MNSQVPFGTDETIRRIVTEYSPLLLRLACTRLGSTADAEDAVQEVFLRLLEARPCFQDAGHEKAWLIRATLQRACDIRRRAERRTVSLEAAAEAAAPIDSGSEIRTAVRALPESYGTVVHLHYYEGYTIREIAKLLGLPAATVGTRLARGRERLRQMLKEEDE